MGVQVDAHVGDAEHHHVSKLSLGLADLLKAKRRTLHECCAMLVDVIPAVVIVDRVYQTRTVNHPKLGNQAIAHSVVFTVVDGEIFHLKIIYLKLLIPHLTIICINSIFSNILPY
jgi:hypothetical protein